MLKLWGRVNSINVQKVLWALDELDVPFERVDAGMAFGVVGEPFYKKMNPNSRVPTIDDDGFVLWESNAIVRYLAAKHGAGSLWPSDPTPARRRRPLDGLGIEPRQPRHDAGLLGPHPHVGRQAQHGADRGRGREATAQQFQVLEQSLDDRDYVAGKRFTMGDIVVGVNVYRWYALDVKRPLLPRVESYHQRLKQRPAFQKHIMKPLT